MFVRFWFLLNPDIEEKGHYLQVLLRSVCSVLYTLNIGGINLDHLLTDSLHVTSTLIITLRIQIYDVVSGAQFIPGDSLL